MTGSTLSDKLRVLERYGALDMDDKRTLISGLPDIHDNRGRGPDRVRIEWKKRQSVH